jgi:glycerol-3-phosphate acyltransferase PlsY
MNLFFAILSSYLVGSIPTALMAGYILGRIDIRKVGSGNAGATNLYRVFGLKPYIAVLSIDMLKGFASSFWVSKIAAGALDPLQMSIICGFAAVLGHIFSIFAKFKGGKGVATAAGVMFAIAPLPMVVAISVYLIILAITNYVSLGSICAAVSVPVSLAVSKLAFGSEVRMEIYALSTILALLIVVTHRANIKRLINGEELKTNFFRRND